MAPPGEDEAGQDSQRRPEREIPARGPAPGGGDDASGDAEQQAQCKAARQAPPVRGPFDQCRRDRGDRGDDSDRHRIRRRLGKDQRDRSPCQADAAEGEGPSPGHAARHPLEPEHQRHQKQQRHGKAPGDQRQGIPGEKQGIERGEPRGPDHHRGRGKQVALHHGGCRGGRQGGKDKRLGSHDGALRRRDIRRI